MPVILEPAINVYSKAEFRRRIRMARDLAESVQIDVVDGIFAAPENIIDVGAVQREVPPEKLHVHLMVQEVEEDIAQWSPLGPYRISVHVEAEKDLPAILTLLLAKGIERGLALGPTTPLDAITPYARDIDFLLLVSVPPGKSGQSMAPDTIDRVRAVRRQFPRLPVGVDGGVTREHLMPLRDSGVESITIGSALFGTPHVRQTFLEFSDILASRTASL